MISQIPTRLGCFEKKVVLSRKKIFFSKLVKVPKLLQNAFKWYYFQTMIFPPQLISLAENQKLSKLKKKENFREKEDLPQKSSQPSRMHLCRSWSTEKMPLSAGRFVFVFHQDFFRKEIILLSTGGLFVLPKLPMIHRVQFAADHLLPCIMQKGSTPLWLSGDFESEDFSSPNFCKFAVQCE